MTHKLPPNLLALFSARPALRYLPQSDHAPEERKTNKISGVAQYLEALHEYGEEAPPDTGESWFEKKIRLKAEKKDKLEKTVKAGLERSKSRDSQPSASEQAWALEKLVS